MKISDVLYKFVKAYFILAAVSIVTLILFLWTAHLSNSNPEIGENAATVDWLPLEASDISYYKTYSNTAYEFNISEKGFKQWADRGVKEISDSAAIRRYYEFYKIEPYPEFTDNKTAEEYRRELDEYTSKRSATATNGLVFSKRWSGGGGVTIIYDRDKKRAYYQSNSR